MFQTSVTSGLAFISGVGMYDWSLCARKFLLSDFVVTNIAGSGTKIHHDTLLKPFRKGWQWSVWPVKSRQMSIKVAQNFAQKLNVLTPLRKLPKNMGDLDKLIVAPGFEKLPKVQKIAQSDHSDNDATLRFIHMICFSSMRLRQTVVVQKIRKFSHLCRNTTVCGSHKRKTKLVRMSL